MGRRERLYIEERKRYRLADRQTGMHIIIFR